MLGGKALPRVYLWESQPLFVVEQSEKMIKSKNGLRAPAKGLAFRDPMIPRGLETETERAMEMLAKAL